MTTPTPEDDVKQLRDALALGPLPEDWAVGPDFDNDGALERIVCALDGAAVVAVTLDFGANNPHLRIANAAHIAAANPARIARLLAHIDAQAVRLEAAERDAEALKAWKQRVIKAAEEAHGPGAFRFKLSLHKNGSATNKLPAWLDQRWVSFVYAEDDAHIGYIAKALEAIDTRRAAIASEAKT